jgi:hypothetical protein
MTKTDASQPFNHGHPVPDDFYRALGYALVAFAEIDGALFALFYALNVGATPDIEQAKRIFYESWNFSARLKVLAHAVDAAALAPVQCAEWAQIRAGIETLKDQRNQLAYSSAATNFALDEVLGLALVPPLGLSIDGHAPTSERLDTQRILAWAVEFEDMADRIAKFLEQIAPDGAGARAPARRGRGSVRRRGG